MSSPPQIEATPLHIHSHPFTGDNNNHPIHNNVLVTSASSIRGGANASSALLNVDGGDIIVKIIDNDVNNEYTNDAQQQSSLRRVIVQRMDGAVVASFELPVTSPTSTTNKSSPQAQAESSGDNDEWKTYSDPIICWASFSDNNNSSSNVSSGGHEGGRKMLCVLGNENTLYVYDVLGDAALLATTTTTTKGNQSPTSAVDNSNNETGGGPSIGHTIPLPFRAKSIYANGNNCGLLIVRIASDEDYAVVTGGMGDENNNNLNNANGNKEPTTPMGLSLPATPRNVGRGEKKSDGSIPKKNDDDDDDEKEEEEMSVEGPPNPVRFPDGEEEFFNNQQQQQEGEEVYNNPAADALYAADTGDAGVPCLFSLRHPLDEIRPLALMNVAENDDIGSAVTHANVKLFSNVNETLIFMGSPRIFHGTLQGQQGNTRTSPICVTYNETLNRHTIWSLSRTKMATESLPLWKTTGRGTWREDERENQEIDNEQQQDAGEEASQTDMSQDTQENIQPLKGLLSLDDNENVSMDQSQEHSIAYVNNSGVPSSFADIHPDFTLTKLFSEQVDESPASCMASVTADMDTDAQLKVDSCDDDKNEKRSGLLYQRHIFLATDVIGKGDLVLCMFMPNCSETITSYLSIQSEDEKKMNTSSEPALLRCYSLTLPESNNKTNPHTPAIQSISHLFDLPCISAQPVQSIPVPLAPFSWQDGCSIRNTSRLQSLDRDTMATDILVLQQGHQGDGLLGRKLGLYRAGAFHVADFTLPKSTLDKFCSSSSPIELRNAVGNRLDIKFINAGSRSDKKSCGLGTATTIRASLSLIMHTSPVAETALRAIESSLVHSCNRSSTPDRPIVPLSLLIRADCVRLFQQTTSDDCSTKIEDVGWYSFTIVLLNLMGFTSNTSTQRADKSNEQPSDAWEMLLQSDFHSAFCEGEGRILFGDSGGGGLLDNVPADAKDKSAGVLSSLSHIVDDANMQKSLFDALHLLHEDTRLCSQSRGKSWTRRIGTFLLHLAEQMTPLMIDYEDHYHRNLGTSRCISNACDGYSFQLDIKQRMSNFAITPCIMTTLDCILRLVPAAEDEDVMFGISGYKDLLASGLNGVCSNTWLVLRLFVIIFDSRCMIFLPNGKQRGQSQCHRDRSAILAMLNEGIYHPIQLHEELPIGVALPLLEAIRRCRLDPPQVNLPPDVCYSPWPPAAFDLVGRNDLSEFLSQSNRQESSDDGQAKVDGLSTLPGDPDNDGLVGLEDYSSMIFPDDNRVKEAARLLRSSRPLFLRVPRPPELSDHDYERSKQERLLLLCRRSIALPLARGALTLGTHSIQSAEQLLIPNIVLTGRVPPTNGMLALDMSSCPTNFRVWPEFHNGVAAGLRLPQASSNTKERTITRTWIKFNKPVVDNSTNSATSPPSYAHGGFLMALGLRGYLSALTTTDLTNYLTEGTITTTVGIFLGMAANKRGSCDPSVSKMLCLHVPSLLPPSFIPMDLASTVQAAAVAGIGLLYQGSSHRLMTEFLLNEIGRQPLKDQNSNDREGFSLVCGLALGCVNLEKGSSTVSGLEDLRIEERLQRYITGVSTGNERKESIETPVNQDMDKNSRIYEVDSLNRDITAPGATLALGLMYIKSHNLSIASSLQLPETHFSLDYIRPDLLSLRVISRSLILWNDIQPSSEWIDLQIPTIVKSSINMMKNAAKKAMNDANLNSMDVQTFDDSEKKDIADFDPQAIRQANAYIVAGACFSLGLKYAGSANREAASAIIQRALWFLELRDNKDVATLTQRPDTSTLITCLCTASTALAMVMAGTGDLDSFRLFRALRWKCDNETLYGSHMLFSSAIGLLFLGGGKCTLGSTPSDVAMLIAAFYPHLPVLSSDNQYHLQALRHLYVLAAHERILEARDVDSNEKVCIPIELSVKGSNEMVQASTPFLIANDSKFVELHSKSDRYYQVKVNTIDWSRGNLSTLFVKRKAGHLSYVQDPNGLRALSIQAGSVNNRETFLKSIKLFSEDPMITSFAEYFCFSSFDDDQLFERFCSDIVYECMREEKSDILPIYLKLFRLIESNQDQQVGIENVWDATLLRTYTEMRKRLGYGPITVSSFTLLNKDTFSLVCERIDDSFREVIELLLANGQPHEKWWEGGMSLGSFLVWSEVPIKAAT